MNTDNKSYNLVLAAAFDHDWQAHLASGVLANNDIPSVIDNELFGAILPIGFNSIGAIRVMVRRDDLERAQEILSHTDLTEGDIAESAE